MKKLNYFLRITVLACLFSAILPTAINAKNNNGINFRKDLRSPGGSISRIDITLNRNDFSTGFFNVDGVVVVFDSSFSKSIGPEDSKKLSNGGENLALFESNSQLSIDGLPHPVGGDSIYLEMWQLQNDSTYKVLLDLSQFNIVTPNTKGFVYDRYLSKKTALNVDTNSFVFTPKNANTATYLLRYVIYFRTSITHVFNLSGCNQYTYKGVTYTTSTTIRDTIKSKVDVFDSVYNITNIIITPIVATTNNNSISGCNSVVYKGITYTSSSTLKDTIKSVQGCDSIYNITNIVVTPIIASTNNIPLSGCNSIVYKGFTYNYSTIVRDTIKSVQGCDSIYNITNIVVTPIIATTNNIPLSGCNSVVYKGITYTHSTIVRDTLKSVQGCDSIYNIATIVITPIVAATNNIPLSGCNSIIYKGITYTHSTIVRDTVKSVQGCDSIYNVANIVITPIIASTKNIPLSGCNNIVYKGITYTTSTTVRDTVKSVQGCDSIYNVANIVITPIVASTKNIPVSGCNNIIYKGITYTTTTTVRDTVKSVQGCDSIYNVANIVITPIVPITKSLVYNGCDSVRFNGHLYNNSTLLYDTAKSIQGCDSVFYTIHINVTVSTTPTVVLGSTSIVANGSSVTFTATPTNGGLNPIYTFKVNAVTVQTGASNTYSSSTLHVGDSVSCIIISHASCITDSIAKSNTIVMTTNVPLTLIGFQAERNATNTICTWQTTAELNTAYFILQRSTNGIEFTNEQTINAIGKSAEINRYSYIDNKDLKNATTVYYRLQMVDKDGHFAFSKIVRINLTNNNEISIYPNPAKDLVKISGKEITTVQITDINGRILLQRTNINSDFISIDIRDLSKGIYLINILSKNGSKLINKLLID